MIRLLWVVLILIGIGAVGAEEACGQQIRGVVRHHITGAPVEGAYAQLFRDSTSLGATVTDSAGIFIITVTAAGEYLVRVRHESLQTVSRIVRVGNREELVLEILMSDQAIALEPMRVVARRTDDLLGLGGYHDRLEYYQKLGIGHFLTREQLEIGTSSPMDHLVQIPYVRPGPLLRHRSVQTPGAPPGTCRPRVFYDGQEVRPGNLDLFGAGPLEGIEVYRGAAQSPGLYHDPTGCGVILIWSRKEDLPGGISWLRGKRGVAAIAIFLIAAAVVVR